MKLVWIGPPCVSETWQTYSKRDRRDSGGAAQGTPKVTLCFAAGPRRSAQPSLHAGDGVHFTMAGYARMWQKAAAAAGSVSVVVAVRGPQRSPLLPWHIRATERKHKSKHEPPEDFDPRPRRN